MKITIRKEEENDEESNNQFHRQSDQILGATIVGTTAGDLISEITVCMQNNIGCRKLAGVQHPYPTTAESIRQCAAQYNKHLRTDLVNEVIKAILEGEEDEEKEGKT